MTEFRLFSHLQVYMSHINDTLINTPVVTVGAGICV